MEGGGLGRRGNSLCKGHRAGEWLWCVRDSEGRGTVRGGQVEWGPGAVRMWVSL